jgi:hypothetical protein
MPRFTYCCAVVALAACAKSETKPAADTLGAGAAVTATPTTISLASLAGTWAMRTMPERGDSTLVTYQMIASADPAGWSFNFPNRKPVPIRVIAVAGDSIVTEAGPYESVLRKGVQVSTHSVMRLQNGSLVGSTVAHYQTSGSDSVLYLRSEGTRAP